MKRPKTYYQELGRKGGRATVEKHGRAHMQRIGRRGFEVTTDRHFQGQRAAHIAWLKSAGAWVYFESTGLQMKYDKNGRPIWPENLPPHPAHDEGLAF